MEPVLTQLARVDAKKSTIPANLLLDHKYAGNIEINALQCAILNADAAPGRKQTTTITAFSGPSDT